MASNPPSGTTTTPSTSAWAPFRHATFTVMWIATVVSNIGGWMFSAASGWLMTELNPDPLIVSLVQVATTLPIFLLAVPAGALADIVDRRKFLIVAEVAVTVIAAIFATIVWLGAATPFNLLLFTFLISAAGALTSPPWQAVVPQLVPRQDLNAAVAANSVGINISRAVGPALSGVMVAQLGIAAPFIVTALSNLGIVGALLWWRPPQKQRPLPVERFGSAVHIGFRYVRHNSHLRSTLIRATAFFLFASAYWALLPLVARQQIVGGAALYGYLLGAIGAAAVAAALALPRLKAALGPDRLVALGTLGTAAAMVLFALARDPVTALAGSAMAGASWIAVLASLNVSAQVALPDWVRGRGLAIFVTVFFGALSLGSAAWGQLAGMVGLPATLFTAAAGAAVAIPITWRWKLQTGAGLDLTPSVHWPAPVRSRDVDMDRGPVMVTVEYRIKREDRDGFLQALMKLADERRRDGAFDWNVFEDVAQDGRFVETFLLASWVEHLRQHERVTQADRQLQELVHRFQTGGPPQVTHLIAAELDRTGD
jgi:predicted MFS family arabinose efflux permease/quinol monooxygenase YgiN